MQVAASKIFNYLPKVLKSLEIQGFKSFTDKVVLRFPEGITAVVGPNGSGKSNVVDAIRWVLGEQSSKNIRINNADDVIFSGTSQKQASSAAQVGLLFDNSQKIFPLDFGEVEIRRKVYRDGSSEYFLNKQQVRLKDIVQLLASAKLGVKGMGIINQGAGDIFLRANSIERREMIEEMIGLKELRLKKDEAGKKIRDTRINLLQAESILSEIGPNLRSLKRQVEKWQARKEKELELASLEKDFFIKKISEFEKESSMVGVAGEEEAAKKLEKEISEKELLLKNIITGSDSGAVRANQERVEFLHRQRLEVQRSIGNLEGQLELLKVLPESKLGFGLSEAKERLENVLSVLRENLKETELAVLKQRIADVVSDLEKFLDQKQERKFGSEVSDQTLVLQEKKQQLDLSLRKIESEIGVEKEKISDHEKDRNRDFEELAKDLEEKRKNLRLMESKILDSRIEKEKIRLRREDLKIKLEEAGFEWEGFISDHSREIGASDLITEDLLSQEKKIFKLKNELSLIGEVDVETIKEYEAISQRFGFLNLQKADLDSALEDLESLSQSLEEKIIFGFEDALKKIDQEFAGYFGIMFEGGKAGLKVEKTINEETGEINFGIEIAISLPRKKIKSLEMLSGGERSLTAIALLFAVINFAKPPFLVLDEVDAALDESNSRKLARVLQEIGKKQVQFILITHNRAVMESASVLYGVTMADGVSKLFSLRFKEAEEIAAQDVHKEETQN